MRSEWVFLRHLAAVHSARAGGTHVNHAPLSTQVSQPDPTLSLRASVFLKWFKVFALTFKSFLSVTTRSLVKKG